MTFRRGLVVDDEPASRAVLKHVLEVFGLEVIVAEDGSQALELLRSEALDLVVTDIRMPGTGGVELASRARDDQGSACPPIVAVTRHPEEALGTDLFELVLRKPVAPSQLLTWLRNEAELLR